MTIIDPVVTGDSEGDIMKRLSQEKMHSIIESKYPWIHCEVLISNTSEGISTLPIIIATHGNKRQEKIVADILKKQPSALLGIGIGSSIDLLTGFRTPAPRFFRRFGGEWLYRLYKNPKKHSKRMVRVFRFLQLCMIERF